MSEHGGHGGGHETHASHGGGGDHIIDWGEVTEVMDTLNPEKMVEAMADVADSVGASQHAAAGIIEASATALLGPSFEPPGGGGGKKEAGHGHH